MRSLARPRSPRHRVEPQIVELPCRRTVDGIIHAGALIALADGVVHPSERQALIGFLRSNGLLGRYGRGAAVGRFNETTGRLPADLAALCDAADALRPLAGSSLAVTLIMQAARWVMAADHTAWPQEVALVRVIDDRLGLPSR